MTVAAPEGASRALEFDGGALHPRVTGRRVLRQSEAWLRPPPGLVLDLSGRNFPLEPLNHRQRRTMEKVLDRFSDAHLVWTDCFVLGTLFQNSYFASRDYHARAIAKLEDGALPRLASGIVAAGDGLAIDEARLADAIEIGGTCLFATPHEGHHWGLWLTTSMVALDHFRRNRSDYEGLFVHLNHPNMRAMMGYMGIGEGDIIAHDVTRAHRFRAIDVPRTPRMDFHVYPEEQAMFRNLAARHGEGTPARRIFVARRSRSRDGYRPLVNEGEVVAAMEEMGFTIVEPELLSVGAQMRLFAGADVVAGLGGGSMFNTVFCRPGTKVLSIESTPVFLDRHANLFASLGLDYGLIVGAAAPPDGPGRPDQPPALPPINGPWRLDVAAALPHIRRFLGD